METEIIIANKKAKKAAWIKKIYKNLDKKSDDILILWIDNIIVKELASIYKSHAKTKHIKIREIFIKDNIVTAHAKDQEKRSAEWE
jgi:hypothetical protein